MKDRIQSARLQAGRAVNRELVMLYWDIGRGIVEKQQTAGWGEAVVERLAADLRAEFPGMRGFSAANIWRMLQFYEIHIAPEFLAQVARELAALLPWWHHVELMGKVKSFLRSGPTVQIGPPGPQINGTPGCRSDNYPRPSTLAPSTLDPSPSPPDLLSCPPGNQFSLPRIRENFTP